MENGEMKVNNRGQITIPKQLLEMYGLAPGDEVELIPLENGIRMQKRTKDTHPLDKMRGILKLKYAETVDEYIEEIRGR